MSTNSNPILVGKFGAPHGVRGEVRLKSHTGDPLAIKDYKSLQLKDGTSVKISTARQKGDMLIVRPTTSQSREDAQKLNHLELFVDRVDLPKVSDEDEYYLTDLIGMKALNEHGAIVGQVIDVPDFGSGELLEIAPFEGERVLRNNSWFVDFTKANVPSIDLVGKTLTVIPPAEVSERDDN